MRTFMLLLFAAGLARADDVGSTVYKQVVPSCVWIHARHARGTATGSGTLIDVERRLALTNYHVVGDAERVVLYFPAFRDGLPVAEKNYYLQRAKSLAISGRVVARDQRTDLALIQLDKLPDGKKAVPLADAGATPGQSVHSIGNTGKSGALWGYVPGKVRQVYQKEWRADIGGKVVTFKAKVVETDSATNPGDSGGPLVNDKGAIVGVTQGGAVDAQLVSTFIDVSEVKKLLAAHDAAKPTPARPKLLRRLRPAAVRDDAGLFQKETVEKAQEIVDELHSKDFDILIETHNAVPEADRNRVAAMSREQRMAYMHSWVRRRMDAEGARGLGILVSTEPRSYYIELPDEQKQHFPADFHKQAVDSLAEGLRNNSQDDALLKILTAARSQYAPK